ncbi:hypothetical protein [Nocardia brasiliensis]|nr:hypothetical protein [Nocardia brasiliensis]
MALLHAGVDTAVIALWLGHADIRSTGIYFHADMTIKQRALDQTNPGLDHARSLPPQRQPPGLPRKPVIIPILRQHQPRNTLHPWSSRLRPHSPRHSSRLGIDR